MVGASFAVTAALSYSRVATGIARILPVVRVEATAHADARFGPPPPVAIGISAKAADGQGGALTFQSAVPHPLARASKSLNG
jgi:hypothetical protein